MTDLSTLDLTKVNCRYRDYSLHYTTSIRMEQLSGIVKFDPEQGIIVGYKDVSSNEFWIRGHIPGRPLMPGVLMLKPQHSCVHIIIKRLFRMTASLGFGGIDKVRFEGRLYLATSLFSLQKQRIAPQKGNFDTQGVVDGKLVLKGLL